MELTLILAAAALAVAGWPHCAAMCAPACAAVLQSPARVSGPVIPISPAWSPGGVALPPLAFHLARIVSYSLVGALAAAGLGILESWARLAPWIRPLWAMLHAVTATLGLWLLITGRQPGWMARIGTTPRFQDSPRSTHAGAGRHTRRLVNAPWGALAAGGAWVAWPCGLLQSALVVAALGNTAWMGAATMATFGLITAAALHLAPWVLHQVGRTRTGMAQGAAVRLAGGLMVAGSGYTLGHDVWRRVAQICGW